MAPTHFWSTSHWRRTILESGTYYTFSNSEMKTLKFFVSQRIQKWLKIITSYGVNKSCIINTFGKSFLRSIPPWNIYVTANTDCLIFNRSAVMSRNGEGVRRLEVLMGLSGTVVDLFLKSTWISPPTQQWDILGPRKKSPEVPTPQKSSRPLAWRPITFFLVFSCEE